MWLTGLVAPRHVGSSQTRARTRVPCVGRQTRNDCTTREAPWISLSLRRPKSSQLCPAALLLWASYYLSQSLGFPVCKISPRVSTQWGDEHGPGSESNISVGVSGRGVNVFLQQSGNQPEISFIHSRNIFLSSNYVSEALVLGAGDTDGREVPPLTELML